jgi:chemotaxis protein CheX
MPDPSAQTRENPHFLRDNMQAVSTNTQQADAKSIVAFVTAVRRVLKTTVNWEVMIDRPRIKSGQGPEYDYSGIISFSGTLVGTVVISFHRDLAIQLINAFVGCEIPADTPDFADAIGEMTNQIVGAAKTEMGLNASISIPTVIMGKGHIVARHSDVPCIVVPCKTAAGEFAIEVSIKTA